ncbi:MAG: hypothetical protein ACOYXB_14850 [Bacteroidota bacterium]
MARYVITAVITGLFFGILDGMIYGNPFAKGMLEAYKPISRKSVHFPAGLLTDLLSGFVISYLFIIIMPVLPTGSGVIQGMLYGLILWYFRIFMGVASDWMRFTIPLKTHLYILLTGLIEMILLGITNGLLLSDKISISGMDVFY